MWSKRSKRHCRRSTLGGEREIADQYQYNDHEELNALAGTRFKAKKDVNAGSVERSREALRSRDPKMIRWCHPLRSMKAWSGSASVLYSAAYRIIRDRLLLVRLSALFESAVQRMIAAKGSSRLNGSK
jgi:hypothetical protein